MRTPPTNPRMRRQLMSGRSAQALTHMHTHTFFCGGKRWGWREWWGRSGRGDALRARCEGFATGEGRVGKGRRWQTRLHVGWEGEGWASGPRGEESVQECDSRGKCQNCKERAHTESKQAHCGGEGGRVGDSRQRLLFRLNAGRQLDTRQPLTTRRPTDKRRFAARPRCHACWLERAGT